MELLPRKKFYCKINKNRKGVISLVATNPAISTSGDIDLLVDDTKNITPTDSLEDWQKEALPFKTDPTAIGTATGLMLIDRIPEEWAHNLTDTQWAKIKRQRSLYGIPLPPLWIKVWRLILKEPDLRDSERASRGGRSIGSYQHLWNLWSEECISKYLDPMDLDLLQMVDMGLPYNQIGEIMVGKYGSNFWFKRKASSSTTPAQVVNNFLYLKLPTKLARGDLTDFVLKAIDSGRV